MFLPEIHIPDLSIGPLPIRPFGVLVATGVLIGSSLAVRRAVKHELDKQKIESLISWLLVVGFVCAHLFQVLMYRPKVILTDPKELLMIHHGLSSYGGFIGTALGALFWKLKTKEKLLPYLDQIAAVFPISWVFGRAGCATAHDHIGRISKSFLAVDFKYLPSPNHPYGPRFDLGLIEMLITIPIAIIILFYARKKRPTGAILGLLCVIYAPIRFPLDALRAIDIREADARYVGLTPAQWLSIALGIFGITLLMRAYRNQTSSHIESEATA